MSDALALPTATARRCRRAAQLQMSSFSCPPGETALAGQTPASAFVPEGTGTLRRVPWFFRLNWFAALDRLVAFGDAVVFLFDPAAVEDQTFIDGDAIGLRAQRLAGHGIEFGPDASRPARSAESRRGGETRTRLGRDAAVNTESILSRNIRLMSGGGSGGAGSGALARMNSGTGERTSAKPQARQRQRSPGHPHNMNDNPPHPPLYPPAPV